MSEIQKYRGSCLCGTVTFEAANVEHKAGNCHCTMCRKFHGAAFATLASLRKADLQWMTGADSVAQYKATNGTVRQFCQNCGSSLTFETPSHPELVELAISTLDDEIDFEQDVHIYTQFGANWFAPTDNLPCFAAGRDSEQIK